MYLLNIMSYYSLTYDIPDPQTLKGGFKTQYLKKFKS